MFYTGFGTTLIISSKLTTVISFFFLLAFANKYKH